MNSRRLIVEIVATLTCAQEGVDVRFGSKADIRPRRHVLLSIEWFAGARSQELPMADESTEIEISSTNEDGHTINGSYWVAAETIHVTLSDGTTGEAPLGNTPAPTLAKIMLQELDRKRRGVG
ncbi:MAG TPA: hypothetical protein VM822_20405 [Pseudolabrys sp.]|jgi:hypothetical protein|nr:hypothetical protein [Pseudolabrys sp.]